MFRPVTLVFSLLYVASLPAATPDPGALKTAKSLFDIMLKHDAAAGRKLFTPRATMTTVHDDGQVTVSPAENWLTLIGTSKDTLLERMWNPQGLQRGAMAIVWGDYDFHRNGKFHHCGVDSFTLVKTAEGWKIASVAYTSETVNCPPNPLGPPPAN